MYKNKAFISYRHVPHDAEVAKAVQRNLEQFRIPRGIRAAGRKRQLGRIFRDKTDLGARTDLTEELQRELDDSEFLIVICSPEAAQSRWVPEEIEYFLLHHGSDRILPVLSSGDPERVYEALFRNAAGAPREPVACDFRGDMRQAVRVELPRLISALVGCTYDELVNRTRRREKKRTMMIASIVSAAVLLITVVSVFFAISGIRVRRAFRAQQIEDSQLLSKLSTEALARGERFDAIRYAMGGVPDEGEKRPVSDDAVYALQQATGAYQTAESCLLTQTGEFDAGEEIRAWKSAETEAGSFLAVSSGKETDTELRIWNTDTGELIYDSTAEGEIENENSEIMQPASSDTGAPGRESDGSRVDTEAGPAEDGHIRQDAEAAKTGEDNSDGNTDQSDENMETADGSTDQSDVNMETADGSTENSGIENESRKKTNDIPNRLLFTEHSLIWAKGSRLEEIDLTNGRKKRAFEETDYYSLMPMDCAGGRTVVWAYGMYGTDLLVFEDGSDRAPAVLSVDNLAEKAEERYNTDSRQNHEKEAGKKDENADISFGRLEDQKKVMLSPDGDCLFLRGLCRVNRIEENLLCALDLRTQEITIAVRGQEILAYRVCPDTKILAVIYEGRPQERLCEGGEIWSGAFPEEGELVLRAADYRSGQILWEEESDCARNIDPQLTAGETIPGDSREAAVLCAGTKAEIYDQDTGKKLFTADFPGFIRGTLAEKTLDGRPALLAVLEDGTVSAFCLDNAEMQRWVTIIPANIKKAERLGDTILAEYGSKGQNDANTRILAFRGGLADEDMLILETGGEKGDIFLGEKACVCVDSFFVIANADGETAAFDAVTGERTAYIPSEDDPVRDCLSMEYIVESENGKKSAELFDEESILVTDKKDEDKEKITGAGDRITAAAWLGNTLFWTEEGKEGLWLCSQDSRILLDPEESVSDGNAVSERLYLTKADKGKIYALFHHTLFRVDTDTEEVTGRILHVLGYNEQENRLMLEDTDTEGGVHIYISDIYSHTELKEKGRRILPEEKDPEDRE